MRKPTTMASPSASGSKSSPAITVAGIKDGLLASAGTKPTRFPPVPEPVTKQGVPFGIGDPVTFLPVTDVLSAVSVAGAPAASIVILFEPSSVNVMLEPATSLTVSVVASEPTKLTSTSVPD